jgi:hypothetical protein
MVSPVVKKGEYVESDESPGIPSASRNSEKFESACCAEK